MTSSAREAKRVLHCYAASDASKAADWISELQLHFGSNVAHVLAEAGQEDGVLSDFSGRPSAGKLIRWARALANFDCVLTYGWGATNIALAHSVFGESFDLPPLIHHEIGYSVDSAAEFTFRRNWFRRIALRSATGVIVETQSLSARAARNWGLATDRLHTILPTFEVAAYDVKAKPDQVPGLIKREEELWLGADVSAALPADLAVLVEGFAQMPPDWQLVLIGNVPARDALQEMAERLELSHRIHVPGAVADAPGGYALLDAYVAPPCGEAFPTGTAKAMAAGKAVCAAADDESARLLARENAAFLSASFKPAKLGEAIVKIADDPLGRAKAGQANRLHAESLFGVESKAAALSAVYGGIFAS